MPTDTSSPFVGVIKQGPSAKAQIGIPKALRESHGFPPQKNMKFHTEEAAAAYWDQCMLVLYGRDQNLLLTYEPSTHTDEEVQQAARSSGLPATYATVIAAVWTLCGP